MKPSNLSSLLAGAGAVVFFCGWAVSQENATPDVHIKPQTSAAQFAQGTWFRVDVDLVLVPVVVRDRKGGFVTGLEKRNFVLYEDKVRQPIASFSQEDAPISVGVIFDSSGSMEGKLQNAREAVADFLNTSNRKDEFFLITFADEPVVAVDFTTATGNIQAQLPQVTAKGNTALLDAIYLGLDQMRRARYRRRALLIVSDGGENRSRYSEDEIKRAAEESDTQVFSIGTYSDYPMTSEEASGPTLLKEIADITGGQSFSVQFAYDLPSAAASIGRALRNEYVIGYRPPEHDNRRWHKLNVNVVDTGEHFLSVHAKSGYYSR